MSHETAAGLRFGPARPPAAVRPALGVPPGDRAMIPLRDDVRASRLTPANTALIALNVAAFAYELGIGARADLLMSDFGMIPARLAQLPGGHFEQAGLAALLTLVTSLFLHGGSLHIAGNMLYLFIFGPAVEERFGHLRYLVFYLLAGVTAGLAMVWMQPDSQVPVVGASGAIAGVLGAYFVLYPRARILTLVPLFVVVEFVQVPALLYLLVWFAVQLYAGLSSAAAAGAALGGVAWWAHVGGFLFGLALAPLLARAGSRRRVKRLW